MRAKIPFQLTFTQARLIMKNEELKSRASFWVKNYRKGTCIGSKYLQLERAEDN